MQKLECELKVQRAMITFDMARPQLAITGTIGTLVRQGESVEFACSIPLDPEEVLAQSVLALITLQFEKEVVKQSEDAGKAAEKKVSETDASEVQADGP